MKTVTVTPGVLPLLAIDRGAKVPLYRQIYEGYREAIVDRRLRGGQRMPSTRSLAAELRISRIPVLNAFEQLLAEGYFESRVGAGTFVARSVPDDLSRPTAGAGVANRRGVVDIRGPAGPSGRRIVSPRAAVLPPRDAAPWNEPRGPFRVSRPAIEQLPWPVWSSLVSRHCRNPRANALSYGDPMGDRSFREAVAAYLRTARAVRCEADQVMVVSGSQQALVIAARVLLDSRRPVWVEEPGYAGARDALAMAGARLVPVPVDDEGLDVAAGIARSARAQAVYVTPSHQYPLGVTMTASRRLQLLDWAHRTGSWILEDDYDSEYRYESQPVASLQGLDRDARVLYIGTFSKVLFPALRVGYLVIPTDLIPHFVAVRQAMDIFAPTHYQAVLTDFIGEGHFGRHLRRMRLLYRERRGALVDALDRELGGVLQVVGDPAGMHLAATLKKGLRDRPISVRAARQGLAAMPLSSCYLGEASRQGLVLGFGGSSAAELRGAVRRLATVLPAERL